MLEAVRVADRDGDLANAYSPRIAKARPRHRRIDAQHREVGSAVLPDHIGAYRAPLRQNHLHAGSAVDNVVICQHEAVRCKDDAGTGARVAAVHVDHGWTDGFDGADDRLRVGV